MTFAEFSQLVIANVAAVLSSPMQIAAWLGAILGAAMVVAGAFVRTMIPLRWLAVGGNVGFVVFGALHPSVTTLLVAVLLLPINIYRAAEMMRLTRRVTRAEAAADLSGYWLKPYMKTRRLRAGQVLFRRGDFADQLYMLVDGEMELVEIGKQLEQGRIFGEIALFSPDRRRTYTARCLEASTVMMIHEHTVKQLYFQNPAFGFHLINLVAGRLSVDVQRLRQQLQELQPSQPAATEPSAERDDAVAAIGRQD